MRTALLVVASVWLPANCQAAGKIDYGSRVGMEVSVVGVSGIGTSHAVIRVEHTPADAKKFCVEYSSDNSQACVDRELREARINDVLEGNCDSGRFITLFGEHLRFIGENKSRKSGEPKYRILGEDGSPLDGDNASGYFVDVQQFQALCPGRAYGNGVD